MKILFVFISAQFLILLLFGCASNGSEKHPLSKDGRIIKQLEGAGKDLSKVRNIEFFLYFPKQEDAENAAQELKSEAYKVKISKDDFKKMWLVLATKKITPDEATLIQLRNQFEAMTAQANGKYLDWGTPMAE